MVALCAVMLVCAVGFVMCALLHDRFGKVAELAMIRIGITLIIVFIVCGVAFLLTLIDKLL